MACVLRVSSENSSVEELLRNSSLCVLAFFKKDEISPGRSRPNVRSSCNIEVSGGEVGDLKQQVSDALVFLDAKATELRAILGSENGVHAVLDFAVSQADVAVQNTEFPAKLLQGMGNLGINLNVSMYYSVF
jgi:hypothetical protein